MNKNEMIIWGVLIAPVIYVALIFDQIPEQVPMHWNVEGEIDRYGSKWEAILVMPIFNILMYLFLKYIPRLDPKKKNYDLFKGPYYTIRLVIALFLGLMFMLMIRAAVGDELAVDKIVVGSIMVLFIILGNYMSNIRSNYFIGVRTPWTLEDPEVWRKTHQLAGRLWFVGGLMGLILVFWLEKIQLVIMLLGLLIPMVLWPIIYSYRLYKSRKEDQTQDS
jgi:uncharacterized membrane protein